MFVIGTTQKLAKELNKGTSDPAEYSDIPEIYQWHMNVFTIGNRKCLLVMNNQTGLNLTLFGLGKQQFDNIDQVIKGSLKQLFQLLEVDEAIMNQMLDASADIVYTKTTSRQILGIMNEIKYAVEGEAQDLAYEEIDAAKINEFNNKKSYFKQLTHGTPYDTFIRYFHSSP